MGLKDFNPLVEAYASINLPKTGAEENSFKVRAVTFNDITYLIQYRLGDLIKVVELFQNSKRDVFSKGMISDAILIIARDFPRLCVEIISICLEEQSTEEIVEKIERLPFPIQLEALIKIGQLTMKEAEGLGNLLKELAPFLPGPENLQKDRKQTELPSK